MIVVTFQFPGRDVDTEKVDAGVFEISDNRDLILKKDSVPVKIFANRIWLSVQRLEE